MEPFIVEKTSWHFRWLVLVYGLTHIHKMWSDETFLEFYERRAYAPYEFCMYWRAVLLWPLCRMAITVALLSWVVVCINQVGITTVATGLGELLVFLACVVGILMFFLFVFWFGEQTIKHYEEKEKEKEKFVEQKPNFFKTLYRSYKKKYCPSIHYESGK